jgi:hypothetical protein
VFESPFLTHYLSWPILENMTQCYGIQHIYMDIKKPPFLDLSYMLNFIPWHLASLKKDPIVQFVISPLLFLS